MKTKPPTPTVKQVFTVNVCIEAHSPESAKAFVDFWLAKAQSRPGGPTLVSTSVLVRTKGRIIRRAK